MFAACGPRWGKEWLGENLTLHIGFELASQRAGSSLIPRVHQWVVAPTYKLMNQLWREYLEMTKGIERTVQVSETRLILPGDYVIEFRSTDNPETLQNVGLDILHMTEAQDVKDRAWNDYLRARLLSPGRLGFAFIGGMPGPTPPRWYSQLWDRASEDPAVLLVNEPSWNNPLLSQRQLAEIEAEKRRLPTRTFWTTFGARFLPESGGVFQYVQRAARVAPEAGRAGEHYDAFWDIGRTHDSNAVSVFRGARQVYVDRWSGTDWPVTLNRLSRLKQYPGRLWIDVTYDPNWKDPRNTTVEAVQGVVGPSVRVKGYKFSAPKKEAMVENLQHLLESDVVELIDPKQCTTEEMALAADAQMRELMIFESQALPSGAIRYKHPDGEHDDMVDACMASALMATEESRYDTTQARNALEALWS